MPELKINDGRVTYSLNGKTEISYNPTDIFFIEKIFNLFNFLDGMQSKFQYARENAKNVREVFDIAREQDKKMREDINNILGDGVCEALFDGINVFAMDGNGLPLWANLLMTIIDSIDESAVAEQKKINPRIEKYLKKYHR